MANRPNILLILTDQQNSSMMSCTGNRFVRTPAMDRLAEGGTRFDRAYCTNPVCAPSRFSLMTGHMPSTIGMLSNRRDNTSAVPDAIQHNALGLLLRRAGYDTAYAGKVHVPDMTIDELGFEHICDDERDELPKACADFLQREHTRPFALVASFVNPHDICYMAIRDSRQVADERRTVERGRVACDTLDAALARPPGVDDATFFERACPPLPPNFEPQADEPEAVRILLSSRPFRTHARQEWTEARWREHRWAYARLTERVDSQIVKLLAALDAGGQTDNTVVILTSDHGDMDASHRMEHKSVLYDEACRIPLIIHTPGTQGRGRVDRDHLVSNGLDILPTLCDYAGVTPPEGLLGRSLRPLVETAERPPWRGELPLECVTGRGIVTQRFKYALHYLGSNREQLTDLAHDPHEMVNALADPRYAHDVDELRARFAEIHEEALPTEADVLSAMSFA
ncbi:MAG: sulfatase-like hydrolase/transferase [Planctomycetes bacterium]|nr:sulfatase-like hydrolase/transferase [Planctomycetota bacterium]